MSDQPIDPESMKISFYEDKANENYSFAPSPEFMVFCLKDKDIMKFCYNGDIYHMGRLITTDKEIVNGLKDILCEYRCPKCKEALSGK